MSVAEQTEARYCRRIEAASIGGLILDPRRLDDVRPWLEPGDFAVAHYGAGTPTSAKCGTTGDRSTR